MEKAKDWIYIKYIIKENEQRLLSLEKIKQKIAHDKGSIIFDYNAVVNVIPRTWLHWIVNIVNKQIVESENERAIIRKRYQYLKKPTDLLNLTVNKDNVLSDVGSINFTSILQFGTGRQR